MGLSITCIDSLNYTPTIAALKRTIYTLKDKINIEKVYWFSDIDFPYDEAGTIPYRIPVTWVKIEKIKNYNEDYAYITLKLCPIVCVEDFNLIIHADGFAVNSEAWTDDFLNYDYIGASWRDGAVGNGGFCLRSRKLYDAFIDMEIKHSSHDYPGFLDSDFYYVVAKNGEKYIPEDSIICKIHKSILEYRYEIKFAPIKIADRFSIEYIGDEYWIGKSLGFHGKHGIAEHYGVNLWSEFMSKRVLITGGAGFIAHHVIDKMLRETDWQIVCLDRLDISGNLNRLHDMLQSHDAKMVSSRLRIVFHDLKAELNEMIVQDIGPIDIVLHLAAGSHVDRSIEYPMEFVQDNTVGTVNMLDYARKHLPNLERFVYFSTDEIFGVAPPGVSYKEYDRYNSTNPYSASKAAAEEFCVAYENTYKMPIVVTHTMNVFGERQHPEKFIPMCIQRARDGEKVFIHANADCTEAGTRMYIHAKDVAEGLMFILNTLPKDYKHTGDYGWAHCPKFNLVGTEEIDNLTLAKMIADAQGKELNYEMVDFHGSRPGHDLRYALDGGLLKSLGWEPKIKLSERIKEMTLWTLENKRWLK